MGATQALLTLSDELGQHQPLVNRLDSTPQALAYRVLPSGSVELLQIENDKGSAG
jgi:hypothetical protein